MRYGFLKDAMDNYAAEVEEEAVRLINSGMAPFAAIDRAHTNVQRSRQREALRRNAAATEAFKKVRS